MRKKLRKTLIWTSIIAIAATIFIYSISYIFPLPALKVVSIEKGNNSVYTDSRFQYACSSFEKNLINKQIEYRKFKSKGKFDNFCSFNYRINGRYYLKMFNVDGFKKEGHDKLVYNIMPYEVENGEIVKIFNDSKVAISSLFIYNDKKSTLTEYYINGKKGRVYKLARNPVFVYLDAGPFAFFDYNFVALDADKIIFIRPHKQDDSIFPWKSTDNRSAFYFKPTNFWSYSYLFVAYNGGTFYIFDEDHKFNNKQSFPFLLKQTQPASQIFSNSEETFLVNLIEQESNKKFFEIKLNRILDYSIENSIIINRYRNYINDDIFFGKQSNNYFALKSLKIHGEERLNIDEIDLINYRVPGEILCYLSEGLFLTSEGVYILPEYLTNNRIKTETRKININAIPYQNLYGGQSHLLEKMNHLKYWKVDLNNSNSVLWDMIIPCLVYIGIFLYISIIITYS